MGFCGMTLFSVKVLLDAHEVCIAVAVPTHTHIGTQEPLVFCGVHGAAVPHSVKKVYVLHVYAGVGHSVSTACTQAPGAVGSVYDEHGDWGAGPPACQALPASSTTAATHKRAGELFRVIAADQATNINMLATVCKGHARGH